MARERVIALLFYTLKIYFGSRGVQRETGDGRDGVTREQRKVVKISGKAFTLQKTEESWISHILKKRLILSLTYLWQKKAFLRSEQKTDLKNSGA